MKYFSVLLLVGICMAPLAAQTVDGRVESGEYPVMAESGRMTVWGSEKGDALFLACSAPTEGWISVGTGSMKMDGAYIFIGFVKDGEVFFRSDMGRGHAHNEDDAATVRSYALREQDGVTWLEIELVKSTVGFSNPLDILAAYGPGDNFRVYHAYRDALRLRF